MRTVAIISAIVALSFPLAAEAANPANGKKVYETNCASCHGPDGNAVIPNTPNFSKRERLEKPDPVLLNSVKNGLNIMPAWKGIVPDNDLADAVAYIRTLAR